MITKADIGALQAKLAAAREELHKANDLRASEVASVIAERDRVQASLAAMSRQMADRETERKYLADEVETYRARAATVQRKLEAAMDVNAALQKTIADASEREMKLRDLAQQAKDRVVKVQADCEAAERKAERAAQAASDSATDIQAVAERAVKAANVRAAKAEAQAKEVQEKAAQEAQQAIQAAQAKAARAVADAEKEAAKQAAKYDADRWDMQGQISALEGEVNRLKSRPAKVEEVTKVVTVEKIVCEREPADIAEIERLKAELAACQSGQAGA